MGRVLAIWLEGYENTLADAMTSELPSLARLREKSARFLLEDELARFTGLTAEHVSSGLRPNNAKRWSNIFFDKESYGIWEEGPLFAPFPSTMRANTVVFDFPFFDLPGLAMSAVRLPGAHMLPAWSSRPIPRSCERKYSKGTAPIRPASGSMGLLGLRRNAVKLWVMRLRRAPLRARKLRFGC